MLFLELCLICEKKRNLPKRGLVVKPLLYKEANKRAQIDLIDLQTCADGDFKFILNYQDHLPKFCALKALRTKRAAEVAYNLLDIFSYLGPPATLQSDNGKIFLFIYLLF